MPKLKQTASQTAGPYVHIGLAPDDAGFDIYDHELGRNMVGDVPSGEVILVEGHVLDGAGALVKDALLEFWQADAKGDYADPGSAASNTGFRGWGRAATDFETGRWQVRTIKPGKTPWSDGRVQAPHLNLWICARGMNIGLNTRMYFADEQAANEADPVLGHLPDPTRRNTLIAIRDDTGDVPVYRFDIRLQGEDETVFFDV